MPGGHEGDGGALVAFGMRLALEDSAWSCNKEIFLILKSDGMNSGQFKSECINSGQSVMV